MKSSAKATWGGVALIVVGVIACSSKPTGGSQLASSANRNADGTLVLPMTAEMGDGTAGAATVMPAPRGAGGMTIFVNEAEVIAGRSATELTEAESCGAVRAQTEPVIIETVVETEVVTEEPAPVALYFVLDNSTSMNTTPMDAEDDTRTRWTDATDAISAFVTDQASAGLNAAIQYFSPPEADAANMDLCGGTAQATSATPMGLLPDNSQTIVDSLTATPRITGTPTAGALQGGIDYCVQYEADNPGVQCIVLLITDGLPTDCCTAPEPVGAGGAGAGGAGAGGDAGGAGPGGPGPGGPGGACIDSEGRLVPIAQQGAAAGVSVFTVGMEGVPAEGFSLLDAIAVAAGTDCTPNLAGQEACNVVSGTAGFLEALNLIRETISTTEVLTEVVTETVTEALPCEWQIPPSMGEEEIETELVNLSLAVEGGEAAFVGAVETPADCALTVGAEGWHYDNPDAPTKIVACPGTCDLITASGTVDVQILLGCAQAPPKLQ